MSMLFHLRLVGCLGLVAASGSMAATLTFEDPPRNTRLSTYTSDGFTVARVAGTWAFDSTILGRPPGVQSLSTGPLFDCPGGSCQPDGITTDTIAIRLATGGLFTFSSFDLGTFAGPVTYAVTGFDNGGTVFQQSGFQSAWVDGPAFPPVQLGQVTVPGVNPAAAVSSVEISLTSFRNTIFYQIDNVVVTAVPEPDLGSVVAVLALAALWTRRRSGRRRGMVIT